MNILIAVLVGGSLVFLGATIGAIFVLVAFLKLSKKYDTPPRDTTMEKLIINSTYGQSAPGSRYPVETDSVVEDTRLSEVDALLKKANNILIKDVTKPVSEDDLDELGELIAGAMGITHGA